MRSATPFPADIPALFLSIENVVAPVIHVKCEALNMAGSIKMKPALRMLEDLESGGRLTKGGALIESSSGNLGIALSMIAAHRGYKFTCVVDPNTTPYSVHVMQAMGAKVIVVRKTDSNGGYLGSRIELIKEMCAEDPDLIWINQYANESNWKSHFDTTAREILSEFSTVHHLFIGVGTSGTLMGCGRFFRERSPETRIWAVDAEGSVAFRTPAKSRKIPGIGTSRRPELLDEKYIDEVVHVSEEATILMCRQLAARGLFVGGSTGSVIAGIRQSSHRLTIDDVVVCVMPDLGFKYVDTIYSDSWVEEHFGRIARDIA